MKEEIKKFTVRIYNTLPSDLLSYCSLENMKIYIQMTKLFVLSRFTVLDPDVNHDFDLIFVTDHRNDLLESHI